MARSWSPFTCPAPLPLRNLPLTPGPRARAHLPCAARRSRSRRRRRRAREAAGGWAAAPTPRARLGARRVGCWAGARAAAAAGAVRRARQHGDPRRRNPTLGARSAAKEASRRRPQQLQRKAREDEDDLSPELHELTAGSPAPAGKALLHGSVAGQITVGRSAPSVGTLRRRIFSGSSPLDPQELFSWPESSVQGFV